MRRLTFGFLASAAIQTGCNSGAKPPSTVQAPAQPTSPPTRQLPTATEVFNLRSECARLGERILEGNPAERGFTATEPSNYKERTNRCYVEVSIQPADLRKEPRQFTNTLHDGQTGDLLAYTQIEHGTRSGMNYKEGKEGAIGDDRGYEATRKYIEKMMKDE